MIDEAAGHGIGRHDALADLVRDEDGSTLQTFQAVDQAIDLGIDRPLMHHKIGQPERQAIHQEGAALGGDAVQSPGQGEWFFDGAPAFATAFLVTVDTGAHLVVEGLGGGDVVGREAAGFDQFLGMGGSCPSARRPESASGGEAGRGDRRVQPWRVFNGKRRRRKSRKRRKSP